MLALNSTAAGQDIIGQATVIDGDTIEIHLQRTRLWGIDAPESDQLGGADSELFRCGSAAASGLVDHSAGHVVLAKGHRSLPARCAVCLADVASIWRGGLCKAGFALDWPQYSRGAYSRIRRRRQGRARACLPEAFSSLGNIALAFERPTAGGPSPGAPKGNQNALKHGRYSAAAMQERRLFADLIREMRRTAGGGA